MPPPDQTPATRPISFIYHNALSDASFKQMTLLIRPEELTRSETSRLTLHHTLGGAYADNFGGGIPTLTLSGHTGWGNNNAPLNGIEHMVELYKFVYTQWHSDRQRAANSGLDPEDIKLLFSDQLDEFTWVVAPQSFTLKRNKSNPLLAFYQINLVWLANDVASPLAKLLNQQGGGMLAEAIASFSANMHKITTLSTSMSEEINAFFSPVHGAIGELVSVATGVNASVLTNIKAMNTVVNTTGGNLLGIASTLNLATANVLASVAVIKNIPQTLLAKLMQVKNAFLTLYCLMHNALATKKQLPVYDIYGSSLCSSTNGGSALSTHLTSNTFSAVLPSTPQELAINSSAMLGINQLAALDNVLMPYSLSYVSNLSSVVVQGMTQLPAIKGIN